MENKHEEQTTVVALDKSSITTSINSAIAFSQLRVFHV